VARCLSGMGRRLLVGLVIAIVGVVASAPASAGGWAVTSVDPFDPPVAGADLEIGFSILQHGRTPVDVDGVIIVVEDPSGATRQFTAEPAGSVGRYRATIELPEAGRYRWSVIQGWFGPQDLGAFDVDQPATGAFPVPWVAGPAAAVAAAGVVGLLVVRRRRQPAVSPNPHVSWM